MKQGGIYFFLELTKKNAAVRYICSVYTSAIKGRNAK